MIATLVALIFLGSAFYVGLSGSWPTAILLFLLAGGVEMTAYALGFFESNSRCGSDAEG